MEIRVRKATAEDYDPLCELFDEGDALHRDHLPHIFQQPNGPAREKDYYLGLLADDNVALLIAEANAHLVGYVQAYLRDAPALPIFVSRHYAVVDAVVVSLEFQHQGIGRRLMDEAQAWAMARGATSIELNVYEFNETAIAFYESLGYRSLSRKMSKELRTDEAAG
ncbi:MAG TPA: GNAT family N-acetyltransferase [Anaerolineales bacterium]